MSNKIHRRSLLRAFSAAALSAPLSALLTKSVEAAPTRASAKRFIVFYFPDGVPAPPDQPSRFHATAPGGVLTLPENLAPLQRHKDACVFLRGLTMGKKDAGTHAGGIRKLLTGFEDGEGESIDRHLARTVGKSAPFPHLYLGAASTLQNANGDPYISYPSAHTLAPPDDDPIHAFSRLFGVGGGSGGGGEADPVASSVIDASLGGLADLRRRLGAVEKDKLDLHLDALRDVERRIKWTGAQALPTCNQSLGTAARVDRERLYDPEHFPQILRAQIDLTVQAMACGLTHVGVVQASQHTSELIMSRFVDTPMYDPELEMRSHESSHYGTPSDPKFSEYVKQRTWFVEQFAYLLDQLAARPDGDGTMLDTSVVLLCTEICDGDAHLYDDMPFVLAGGASGSIRTGQLLEFPGRRHADMLGSIGHAMGLESMTTFGSGGKGLLEGLFV